MVLTFLLLFSLDVALCGAFGVAFSCWYMYFVLPYDYIYIYIEKKEKKNKKNRIFSHQKYNFSNTIRKYPERKLQTFIKVLNFPLKLFFSPHNFIIYMTIHWSLYWRRKSWKIGEALLIEETISNHKFHLLLKFGK